VKPLFAVVLFVLVARSCGYFLLLFLAAVPCCCSLLLFLTAVPYCWFCFLSRAACCIQS
jgi:hypothetical protein